MLVFLALELSGDAVIQVVEHGVEELPEKMLESPGPCVVTSGGRDPQDSKTFDPTPQRKKQFRDEGKVAQSKDVTSAVMFVASLLAFGFVGGDHSADSANRYE